MISSNFIKTHLTYDEQITLLESRGLLVEDKALAKRKLKYISYYRLSAYFLPFQKEKDVFIDGTRFEDILRIYYFDKALRKIIFNAIETIEINIRADIAYNLSKQTGAFGYMEKQNLNICYTNYLNLMQTIQRETHRSKEAFVAHFKKKYRSDILPIWMVVEIISFSTLSKFFKALKSNQESLTATLNVPPKVLKNWLHVINHIRNICAHHGRLWNKQFAIKALIPKRIPQFKELKNDKMFTVIIILNHMFKHMDTGDGFIDKIKNLLEEYPKIPLEALGFPEDWEERLA
ncbi:Abortive infection bacteriophage resistance protein [hydrothermal vent metagenome]|uniref:Abortive infection bacteriophage resistance protein n=1 Tax=hydrothermal vent metagenome TaxID=652676 RepID=A0A1W1E9X0_9ZZZZ